MANFIAQNLWRIFLRNSKASAVPCCHCSFSNVVLSMVFFRTMKPHFTKLISLILVSIFFSGISDAQPSNSRTSSTWLTEKWTGDEKKWFNLRESIDREIAKNSYGEHLLQRLKVDAQQNTQDAQAQFRWAYVLYQKAVDGSVSAEKLIPVASRALSEVQSPRVSEFTRLRFLLIGKMFPDRRLLSLGNRLAQLNPNDYSVKYRLVKILDPGLSPQEKQQALLYARDLVRLKPERASAHASLASVYFRSWLLSKNQQDKAQALASYKRYLQLAPKSDSFRSQAQRIIAQLEKA